LAINIALLVVVIRPFLKTKTKTKQRIILFYIKNIKNKKTNKQTKNRNFSVDFQTQN
jgi:hypothetical protein